MILTEITNHLIKLGYEIDAATVEEDKLFFVDTKSGKCSTILLIENQPPTHLCVVIAREKEGRKSIDIPISEPKLLETLENLLNQ